MPRMHANRPRTATAELHEAQPLAPPWHTATLIAVILSVAATGALLASRGVAALAQAAPSSRVTAAYLPMIVAAWTLLLYVCRIGRPRNQLPALLGQTWNSPARAAADIALALSGWLLIMAFELAWARWVATGVGASVAAMLPQTWLDGLAWGLVSVSVGFCEEVVFRGYLQTQLTAFTGRAGVAMVLQARARRSTSARATAPSSIRTSS